MENPEQMQNNEVFFPALLITDPLAKYHLDNTWACFFLQGDRPFCQNRNTGQSPLISHKKHLYKHVSILLYH